MTSPFLPLNTERVSDLAPQEALSRAEQALRCGDVGLHVAAFYLADIEDKGSFIDLSCPSMDHLISQRLRRNPKTMANHMWVARRLRHLPEVEASFAAGRINYSQVRLLVTIATPTTDRAWAEWAERHDLGQLKSQVATREKGQLPTEPGRRRIHEPRVQVGAKLTVTQNEVWRRARAKLEAMCGEPISDRDMCMQAAQMILRMGPDGTVPGWTRVNDRHYLVHAWAPEGLPTIVTTSEDGKHVAIDPHELAQRLELTVPGGELVLHDARVPIAQIDPENAGPDVPTADRDPPTGDDLRDEVLLRDGFQCRSCGSRKNVTVHHRVWRRHGGKTVRSNLMTACEACHSLFHARLLFVLGDTDGELTFLDRTGQPLRPSPGQPVSFVMPSSSGPSPSPNATGPEWVDFDGLPAEVDGDWWARAQQRLSWNERHGELVLTPGPVEPAREPVPTTGAMHPPASPEDRPTALETASTTQVAPTGLAALTGQDDVRARLSLAIAAAQQRGESLRPLLFTGGPGLGKTSLARAVAADLRAPIVEIAAPHVKTPETLVRALASLEAGSVLFVDELHALPGRAGEILYEALDRGTLTLPIRYGLRTRAVRLRLRPFTLVGATTHENLLRRPLLSRLQVHHLEPYGIKDLTELATRAARAHGLELASDGAERLAMASRETPRRALALLDLVRDVATIDGASDLDLAIVERALDRAGVDREGLDGVEREYLRILEQAGRPVGLSTLASRLQVSEEVLRSVHEPHLVRRAFVQVTRDGRVLGPRRRAAAPGSGGPAAPRSGVAS